MPFVPTPEWIEHECGFSEGRREGVILGRLEGIQAILGFRFGATGLQLMPEIEQIRDRNMLKEILYAAITVASPEDLRGLILRMLCQATFPQHAG